MISISPLTAETVELMRSELNGSRRDVIEDENAQVEVATVRTLNDSLRVLRAGRAVQRRADCRLIEAHILELRKKGPHDLNAVLCIEELNTLRDQITSATK